MALKRSGVQLVAEGDAAFMSVMMRAGKAVVEFGDASDAAGNKAAAYAQRINRLTDTIGLQARQLGLMERQLKETAAAHGADSLQAQRQQLAIDRLSASMRNNQATVDRLTAEMGQLDRAQDQAAKGASKMGEVMTGALRRVGELVVNVGADLARAFVSGVGAAVDMAGDYEQAMNVLQAQSGATDAQMQQMRDTAKALGADLTLPATSAVDAGKAMLELSKGGLSVEQSMAAAKGTLQLAAAAETDVATAANITTGALQAFGLEGDKAGYIADLLANSANISRASMTDLAQGFQQGAFAFKAAGMGADELAASLAILSNVGLTGSDSGTALKNALQRLFKPTKEAAGVMRDLGFNAYDAQGNMLPMRELIAGLDKSLAGLTQQERNAALGTIFLSDGMKAMIPLLNAGVDGFDKTRAAVNRQGAASELAAAQMKGLHGAAQGLQSQVETLALNAIEPLLPLMTELLQKAAAWVGSFTNDVGPAVMSIVSGLQTFGGALLTIGEAIVNAAVPALATLITATIAYGVIHLPLVIAKLQLATAALATHGAAFLAVAAPIAIIVGALAAVILKWNEFADKVSSATDKLLETKMFWNDSTRVLENYGKASEDTQGKLKPLADSIEEQRNLLHSNIESLGQRMAAGLVTEEQYKREMEALNAQGTSIKYASQQLNDLLRADLEVAAASMTATEKAQIQTDAHGDLIGAIELTEKELEDLAKTLDKVYADGAKAVETYVNTAIEFEAKLTKAIKEGSDEQAADAAASYAEQAAAARASIGEQLSAYTIAQMQLGNISEEQAGTILTAIEKQFGTTQSISASTFLKMEQTIDKFAQSGGESADALGKDLDAITQEAVDAKTQMDALAKKYEAELIQNFKEGKIDSQELRRELEKIPAKVYSEVYITTRRREITETGESGGRVGGERGAAHGAMMRAGETRRVGEHGPELFTAPIAGRIVPPAQMPRPQIVIVQPASTQNYYGPVQNGDVYNQRGAARNGSTLSAAANMAFYGSRG